MSSAVGRAWLNPNGGGLVSFGPPPNNEMMKGLIMQANDGHMEYDEEIRRNFRRIQHWDNLQTFRRVVDEVLDMYADGINSYYITCLKIGAACDALGNPDQMEA